LGKKSTNFYSFGTEKKERYKGQTKDEWNDQISP